MFGVMLSYGAVSIGISPGKCRGLVEKEKRITDSSRRKKEL